MNLPSSLSLAFAISLGATAAMAQTAADTSKPAATKPARPAPKPATPREELKSEAKGLALATETTEAINAAQLDISARVLTGKATCEYNQAVDVDAVEGQPGYFRVKFKNVVYTMVPEETTTGAVRLLDRKASVMWLQIPVKSMLMDNRAGHRLVDMCTHAEQRAAVAAVNAAAANAAARASEPAATPRQ